MGKDFTGSASHPQLTLCRALLILTITFYKTSLKQSSAL